MAPALGATTTPRLPPSVRRRRPWLAVVLAAAVLLLAAIVLVVGSSEAAGSDAEPAGHPTVPEEEPGTLQVAAEFAPSWFATFLVSAPQPASR